MPRNEPPFAACLNNRLGEFWTRATQFELGGSAGLLVGGGAYLGGGTTRSAWGDNRVTLGLSGTLGMTGGATFELQRVRGMIQNREGSISNAIQKPSGFYNVVPGIRRYAVLRP